MNVTAAIERAMNCTRHWRDLAPNTPLERFIAQEILMARADAFDEAGWHFAARVCRSHVTEAGYTEIPEGMICGTRKESN